MQGPCSVCTGGLTTGRTADHPAHDTGREPRLWAEPASVTRGFINRLLMKVTRAEGAGSPHAVLRRGEMCLLKCVMRDITNPQYWAKLSLNPLMIAVFSLVRRTGLYRPLWRGVGGAGGWEGAGQGAWGRGVCKDLSWRPRPWSPTPSHPSSLPLVTGTHLQVSPPWRPGRAGQRRTLWSSELPGLPPVTC